MTVATAVAAGAGAGSGATATLAAGSNDERGEISVTTAGTPAAGILATITFAGSWQGYAGATQVPLPTVMLCVNGTNTPAAALAQLSYQWNAAKTTLSIYCSGTPVTATTYVIDYLITG